MTNKNFKIWNLNNSQNFHSEFRQDLITKNWILIAASRGKRPRSFIKKKGEIDIKEQLKNDPFADPQASGNGPPLLVYPGPDIKNWSLQVISNKYPAVKADLVYLERKVGPYNVLNGVGNHEVIITRDPLKHLALLELEKVEEVIEAYHSRFNDLRLKKFVKYISIFHNHGLDAGASLVHPHSQIIAIPIIPADTNHSLIGSEEYYKKNKTCVHCLMIEWEKQDGRRIVFENDDFIAFCPFISRSAFEIRIFPKAHSAYFESLLSEKFQLLAESLKTSLFSLYKTLDDPDYNFFIHTAPVKGGSYDFYHWHIEILPKTSIFAGFELGTGIEISSIEPEKAAKFLRNTLKKV